MNKKVLCTGSLIVDIFNEPTNKALGPNEGALTKIFTYLGGNSFNVSKDLINLNFSGDDITCIGAVGDDLFKDLFSGEINHLGLTAELYTVPNVNTSKIFILKVEDELPRYYFDPGANAYLPPDFIISRIQKIKPAIFYTGETGSLQSIIPHFPEILKTAQSLGSITIVDIVVPSNEDWSFIDKSSQYIDVLKCNEYESLSLTKCSDVRDAARKLNQSGIPLVIISLAEKGLIYSYKGDIYELPAFKVKCVDSTGAGDAFIAGIIKSIVNLDGTTLRDRLDRNDNNLITAIIYAAASGAAAVTENGCYDGVSESKVIRLISEQGDQIIAGKNFIANKNDASPVPLYTA